MKESAAFIVGCQARSPGSSCLKGLNSLKAFREIFFFFLNPEEGLCPFIYLFLFIYLIFKFYLFNLFNFLLCWVFVAVCVLFSGCGKRGLLFIVARGLLIAVASLVAEDGL